ncbi:MAG: protein kinase [Ktedonobacteraceae bacterium]|nr:protein kinase [Ktedonobacteraceae bacterium]
MLKSATYDIPFSFEQPDSIVRALLNPIQQRLKQVPPSSNPRQTIVRNGLTILIIDAYQERAQYVAGLLMTSGYRPVVTPNALAAYTLFLQGAYLPLAVVIDQGDESNRLFLLRLLQQLEQRYGWQAPLLRLLAPARPIVISAPPPPIQNLRALSPFAPPVPPSESLTPPPMSQPVPSHAALPAHTRLSISDKNSSASFPPLSSVPTEPLSSPSEPISEPLGPVDPPVQQLDFANPASIPLPASMVSALPQLGLASQIPELSTPESLSPTLPVRSLSVELAVEQHTQDAEEMLARIAAYRKARISLEGQTVIIRYQARRLLGAGAYSDVYLTHDRFREQDCALKAIQTDLLPMHLLQASLEDVTIFQQEIELLNKIKHPHILPVLNSGKSYIKSAPFIYKSMPYCPEGSLTNWMKRRGESNLYALKDLLPIILQLGEALQYAHTSHILYQNFKQSNILVQRPGKHVQSLDIALADFSTVQDAPLAPMSPESPLYVAPERWEGTVLPASDQYGLAAIIYELLTGRPPYQGISARILRLLHTTKQPQPASTLNRKLSRQVDEILLRALSKKPEDRFESIAHFVQALERCQ